MTDTNTINPDDLARKTREDAVRQAEEKYRNDLAAAARARESAIRDAVVTSDEAHKQAQAVEDIIRKRLRECRDRVEAKLRKQELEDARRVQKQLLTKAEDDKAKSLKLADEVGKRLSAEAAEARRLAMQLASENEKKMKMEAVQALKAQKEAARLKDEEERKSMQRMQQEAEEAADSAKKAAAVERSSGEAAVKKPGKQEKVPAGKEAAGVKSEAVEKASTKNKQPAEKTAGPRKSEEHGLPLIRQGMIKLIIVHKDANSDHMIDFEKCLRDLPDVRLVMIGGSFAEGAQIIIASEKPLAMSEILRRLPLVEEVDDRRDDILIKLKPVVILQNNI